MRRIKNKTGFSLVELLLAFAIIAIIFAAVVPQFRAIRNSWAGAEASATIVQNGRVLAEHFSRNLSSAKQITEVSGSGDIDGYIIFQDNAGATKRYMLSGGYVVFGDLGSESQLAGPVSSFKIVCYSLDDFGNPTTDVNSVRLVKFETIFPNENAMGSSKTFQSEVFIQANAEVSTEQSVIDIMVKSGRPDTVFDCMAGDGGCDAVIDVDGWQNGDGYIHGLLLFKDIVGDVNGQVPSGTEITQAKIKLWYVNHNNNADVYFYRMTVPWTELSTWKIVGGGIRPGVNCDSSTVVTTKLGSSVPQTVEVDVTDIVRSWINGDCQNYGFGIVNSSGDNFQFAASENVAGIGAHTPILEIAYSTVSNEPGIAMQNYVSYGGWNATIDSYHSASGNYGGRNVSDNAVVAVNAIGSGKIQLYSSAILYGDAYIGPDGDPSKGITYWGSTITGEKGTLDQEIDMPNPTSPSGKPFNGSNEGDFPWDWRGGEQIIDENHYYNNLAIWNHSYITIKGNITILLNGNFQIGSGTSIRIANGSSLNLYIRGSCDIGGDLNSYFEKLPSDLKIYMLNNNRTFNVYGSSNIYAMLYNPRGPISDYSSGAFYGQMRGKSLEGSCKIHVDLDSSFSGSGGSGGNQDKIWIFSNGAVGSGEVLP